MQAEVENRIVIEPKKVTPPGRAGTIEQVPRDEPPTYRIRWDDGRTTVLAPSAGGARIESPTKKRDREKPTT